ncbi:MAG: hypothetical protein ACEPOV_00710 [Hyphomicrobiales bacterium]
MEKNKMTTTPDPHPRKKKSMAAIFAVVFGVIAIILAIWQISSRSELVELRQTHEISEEQKVALQSELDSLLNEHQLIKEQYVSVSDSLKTADQIIIDKARQIKKLMKTKYSYQRVKKELDELKASTRSYGQKIDSLYAVNEKLVVENQQIRTDYNEERMRNDSLTLISETLNNKVATASILKTYDIKAEGVKVRGNGKEKVTDKIRRLNKLRICFKLGENDIVEKGIKEIYVRIAQPNDSILIAGEGDEYSFNYEGNTVQYSIAQEVEYTGDALDLCLYYDVNKEMKLSPGNYQADIFAEGHSIGTAIFSLRK